MFFDDGPRWAVSLTFAADEVANRIALRGASAFEDAHSGLPVRGDAALFLGGHHLGVRPPFALVTHAGAEDIEPFASRRRLQSVEPRIVVTRVRETRGKSEGETGCETEGKTEGEGSCARHDCRPDPVLSHKTTSHENSNREPHSRDCIADRR